jgi:hypothetical protein
VYLEIEFASIKIDSAKPVYTKQNVSLPQLDEGRVPTDNR